jgi:invasion protein IalB
MRRTILPALIALLLLAPGTQAAETPGVWHKACDTPKDGAAHCAVEQIGVAEPGDRPVLRVAFEALADKRAKVIAQVPLGISLRAGLDLVVDGAAPIKLPFERCLPGGCEVSAILDAAALEQFVKGTTLTVRYAPNDAQSASMPLKLEGLSAALASLAKK